MASWLETLLLVVKIPGLTIACAQAGFIQHETGTRLSSQLEKVKDGEQKE